MVSLIRSVMTNSRWEMAMLDNSSRSFVLHYFNKSHRVCHRLPIRISSGSSSNNSNTSRSCFVNNKRQLVDSKKP